MKISEIQIGTRHRKNLGDIDALAASISAVGLLHPIVVNTSHELIAGERRYRAVKQLGWKEVDVTVCASLDDVQKALQAERDENACRLDFAPSEAVAMAKTLEPFERKAASERRATSNAERENFSPSDKGKSRDRVAEAVGLSAPTLAKAKAIVEAAEAHPGDYKDIAEEMDRTGKVSPAYNELAKRAAEPDRPHVQLTIKPQVEEEEIDPETGKPFPPVPPGNIFDEAKNAPEVRAIKLIGTIRGAIIAFRDHKILRDLKRGEPKTRRDMAKRLRVLLGDLKDLTLELENSDDKANANKDRATSRKAG